MVCDFLLAKVDRLTIKNQNISDLFNEIVIY